MVVVDRWSLTHQMDAIDVKGHFVGGDFVGREVAEGTLDGPVDMDRFHVVAKLFLAKTLL